MPLTTVKGNRETEVKVTITGVKEEINNKNSNKENQVNKMTDRKLRINVN